MQSRSSEPTSPYEQRPVLVVGSTGKTGRRVVERLASRGLPVRHGSRRAPIPFDWDDPQTWAPALDGVRSAYVTFHPDLAVPGAPAAIERFSRLATEAGVQRLVLLSGRGEAEAQRCERIVAASGATWTVVRASWFAQNFSEAFLLDAIVDGTVALPVDDVREPFVDADDIADVAVAALTTDDLVDRVVEVTGPRLMTFAEAVGEIADATGRDVRFLRIPHEDFLEGLGRAGVPENAAGLLDFLFREVLDGRNASLTNGVEEALGRPARDFREYVARTVSTGVWSTEVAR
ncbi:MAG TPA: NAD(P)H-binding protein [Candidatus Krumholzibacteria bacterium]|nr:NAD(P)H-binding protein [Candidatus Krumholzibacteria bacterium]